MAGLEKTALELREVDSEMERIEDFIGNHVANAAAEVAVVGLSGGIDSATVLGLCSRALGSERVRGVFMPGEGTPDEDLEAAIQIAETFGVSCEEIPISGIVEQFASCLPDLDRISLANVKVRTRMVLLYAISNQLNGLVLGTGNLSEWALGYFTKYGDGAADISPVLHLYKLELYQIAEALNLPRRVIEKEPSAGLWDSQTDREELGAGYEVLDPILYCKKELGLPASEAAEKLGRRKKLVQDIYDRVEQNEHKRKLPPRLERK